MEIQILEKALSLLSTTGWLGVIVLVVWLVYKTTIVSLITIALFKAFKLMIVSAQSRTLSSRIAAELGVKLPLTSSEEKIVLEAVRTLHKKSK